jgi:TQXA domain-containing protein
VVRLCLALVLGSLVVALQFSPADAVWRPTPPGSPAPTSSPTTQLTLSATGAGQAVSGFITNNPPIDPTTPYPNTATTPPGFSPQSEGFAGIIIGTPVGGGPNLQLYCIDILTNTYIGYPYGLGTWDQAAVPNVGYVAQVLDNYYPNTALPALPADQQAAAVQAAIWYFSDGFILSSSDPLFSAVQAIVANVQTLGPVAAPNPPSLTITPTVSSVPAGSLAGPFTVTTSAGTATVQATGATMFSNAAGTTPIANGATVSTGQQIWLQSTGPPDAVLQATATATVPAGNVYLYSGQNGPDSAQKLILASTSTLTTTVNATAEFQAPGSLVITKTVQGPAAGSQGPITIHSVCDGTALVPDFVIAAGFGSPNTSTGQNFVYTGIPAGSTCTVTETQDGSSSTVAVEVTGDGQQVKIPAGGTANVGITDTYTSVPGSLVVSKLIGGDGAGQQGQITIGVSCGGTALPDFVIPANSAAGAYTQEYDDIPAGTVCTVTESQNGTNTTVTVVPTGSGQTVTIPAGGTATADLSDDVTLNPGSLVVSKAITGPAAGLQGQITISVTCDGTALPDFVIPAGTAAGTVSNTYTGIPAGSVCTVTETQDGSSDTVAVATVGSGQEVTVPAGGTASATITDTYTNAPGDLIVNKTIDGDAAGLQGQVTISVSCTPAPSNPTPDFVIPAGAAAGTYSQTYTGLAADSTCTVTETQDGSSSTVTVVTTGSPQTVTIPPGDDITADIGDTYSNAPGSLVVNKTIAGPSAGSQGQVTISVECDGTSLPDFVIPAGTAAGTVSMTYPGIAAGSQCTVSETQDGSTSTVDVTIAGDGQTVAIPAGGAATVGITDTYSPSPGSIVVTKSIGGPLAGQQGQVTITAECDGTPLTPDFVIPAGSPAGDYTGGFDGIPAGSTCTVTETQDGGSPLVTVATVGGEQTVQVGAGDSVPVSILDTYTDSPGSIQVTKTIAGGAAGQQGEISILVSCGQPISDFVFQVAAGTAAGSVSQTFDGIPAGNTCTVTETTDGSSSQVTVVTVGSGQQVSVPVNAIGMATITDTYSGPSTPSIPGLPNTGYGGAAPPPPVARGPATA